MPLKERTVRLKPILFVVWLVGICIYGCVQIFPIAFGELLFLDGPVPMNGFLFVVYEIATRLLFIPAAIITLLNRVLGFVVFFLAATISIILSPAFGTHQSGREHLYSVLPLILSGLFVYFFGPDESLFRRAPALRMGELSRK